MLLVEPSYQVKMKDWVPLVPTLGGMVLSRVEPVMSVIILTWAKVAAIIHMPVAQVPSVLLTAIAVLMAWIRQPVPRTMV
jgi:hypothetical protein